LPLQTAIRPWLRPPRRALLIFLAATGLLLITLVLFGAHLRGLQMDEIRPLERIWLALLAVCVIWAGYVLTRSVIQEQRFLQMQTDFINAVSHDLRTPLTSILQSTEMLLGDRLTAIDKRREHLRRIDREGHRLHRLVEDILDFGRMKAQVYEYRMRPVDLVAMVREVVEQWRIADPDNAPRLHLDTPAEDIVVIGDRETLSRALWNLIDNALKYSPEERPVEVTVRRMAGAAAVRVLDRGLGIPRIDRRQVFDRFYRGEGARQLDARGAGLGLTLVREIVGAHDGEVELDSATGSGSAFTILLPLVD
jgi:signal transduction histidine kinase